MSKVVSSIFYTGGYVLCSSRSLANVAVVSVTHYRINDTTSSLVSRLEQLYDFTSPYTDVRKVTFNILTNNSIENAM